MKLRTIKSVASCIILILTYIGCITSYTTILKWSQAVPTPQQLWQNYFKPKKEIVREVVAKELDLPEAIKRASKKYGIPEKLIQAIVDQESSGGLYNTRFEYGSFKPNNNKHNQASFKALMDATSHGPMHVMGFNAPLCHLDWTQLYTLGLGIDCGTKLLHNCLEKHKRDFKKALGCYNGDRERYPLLVLAKVGLSELNKHGTLN